MIYALGAATLWLLQPTPLPRGEPLMQPPSFAEVLDQLLTTLDDEEEAEPYTGDTDIP